MSWIDDHAPPNGVVIDIGANQGSLTAQFADRVGPHGVVYAIEPQRGLRDGLSALHPAVRVLTMAIGATDGTAMLHLGQQSEHASLYEPNVLAPTGEHEAVMVRSLDSLQGTGELPSHVDLIKVDTQGAEAAILRGAARLLREARPAWYLELWPIGLVGAGAHLGQVRQCLEAAAYVPDGRTWAEIETTCEHYEGHGSMDMLFLPAERVGPVTATKD